MAFPKEHKSYWKSKTYEKMSKRMKGNLIWKKRRNRKLSDETKIKISVAHLGKRLSKKHIKNLKKADRSKTTGINNYLWKGEKVGYRCLHLWVQRHLGKAKKCEHCGIVGSGHKIHWANINHKYKRNLRDWIQLYVPCHKAYDKILNPLSL